MVTSARAVKIVMIEDDEGHARLIEKNIRRAGVTNDIVAFVNGTEALSFLLGSDGTGSEHIGQTILVLLDLNLPDMTGMDILARMRGSAHLNATMVIILTTTDDPREVHRCYDLGANVYIPKPMQYERFVNAIQQLGLFLSVMAVPEAR
ncbi:response regulator [Rhizobium sp. 32-5/1]|uniref:response regulator n=1 Tax=Rhizobium sp. 32-5/1 TaxID=3019602 RepID=UPI00240E5CC3|nr:response regulator [Rhizobium sp. 32-5/1]WEZ84329.1 response regulator [Rhizobium sp. 32-5/1]